MLAPPRVTDSSVASQAGRQLTLFAAVFSLFMSTLPLLPAEVQAGTIPETSTLTVIEPGAGLLLLLLGAALVLYAGRKPAWIGADGER